MPRQASKAKQVSSLGETPAQARARMDSGGGSDAVESETQPPLGKEVEGPLGPQHMAAIRDADEGFGGGPAVDGTVQDAEEITEPPTPEKAMGMIRQLSQDKTQFMTERDAALSKVARYEAKYGELD